MSLWKIAWRSIRQRALASGMTAFAMGLGVALVVSVLVIHSVINQAFLRGVPNCNFIVGPKGSQYQLVLNTVFHMEQPLGLVPYKFYEEIQNRYSPLIDYMVPICLGHDLNGYPAIATTQDYLGKLTYREGIPYEMAKGRNFLDENFYEAVIGDTAARWLGLKIGDKVMPLAKGAVEEKGEHGHHEFEIVGILAPTGTPNDRAVFLNIEGFWRCPAHNPKSETADAAHTESSEKSTAHAEEAKKTDSHSETAEKSPPLPEKTEKADAHLKTAGASDSKGEHAGEDAHADEPAGEHDAHDHQESINRQISAILVNTKNVPRGVDLMIYSINQGVVAQAVQPVSVIRMLLQSMVGKIQIILLILAVLVVVEAGIGIMVSMYNSMSDRKHDIAIMRALGASRFTVMTIVLFESILLSLGGGLFGMLVGHGMVASLSSFITEQSGVPVSGLDFRPVELIIIPGLIVLATLVGYLPAMYAYKTDVAKSLMAGT